MRNINSKLLFSLLFFFFIALTNEAYAQFSKSKLKVLYVGGTTDAHILSKKLTREEKDADIKRRMASFEAMLKTYFDQVTVVHAKDYKVELSAAYDVTVMDGVPGAREYANPNIGRKLNERVNTLPDDFSDPVLFIAETSMSLGSKIGLKYDWYCLCLDDYALNMRMEHDIFKKPFPVKITTSPRPLPREASSVNYREKPFPATLPMWKVQTDKFGMGISMRPGLICPLDLFSGFIK